MTPFLHFGLYAYVGISGCDMACGGACLGECRAAYTLDHDDRHERLEHRDLRRSGSGAEALREGGLAVAR